VEHGLCKKRDDLRRLFQQPPHRRKHDAAKDIGLRRDLGDDEQQENDEQERIAIKALETLAQSVRQETGEDLGPIKGGGLGSC
jgi:hypothetical protein